jgi:hypothetical protein
VGAEAVLVGLACEGERVSVDGFVDGGVAEVLTDVGEGEVFEADGIGVCDFWDYGEKEE